MATAFGRSSRLGRALPTATEPGLVSSERADLRLFRAQGDGHRCSECVNRSGSATADLAMTREELMEIFREAAGTVDVPLAPKWEGGVIQIIPGKRELQAKELPIDALFHKVVMIRDRLRTLEQRLNAHPKLSDAEKVELQQYITRIYGSLTSFNVLFRERGDQFIGAKGED